MPYRPDQLFDLVADVERYPEFLPWCRASRVVCRDDGGIVADLVIGYKMFSEKFRSEVKLDRPQRIAVRYLSGPLSHLSNQWDFRPDDKGGCRLSFHVDFDFRSPLLKSAMQVFFDKALMRMVEAFEARARHIYGKEETKP